jgi:type III secretion protein J
LVHRLASIAVFRLIARCALLWLTIALVGCSVPVASGLLDEDANQVIVALERSGIAARKEADPEAEARFRVNVAQTDASDAVAILAQESLPPAKAPGVLDTLGESGIVPSRAAEHARLIAGTAGELERSLRAVDGVLSARVHLAVPELDPLSSDEAPLQPTASVLMRHRGATPPIAPGEVQRLVAGAVPGLLPAQVNVVLTSIPRFGARPGRELARLGPIAVTRGSMLPLKIVVGTAAALNVLLLGLMLALWARMRRAEHALREARAADAQPH